MVSALLFTLFAGSLAAGRGCGAPQREYLFTLWVLAGALFAGVAQPLHCFVPLLQLSALSGRWEELQGGLAGRVVQILPGGDSHLARMS